MPVPSLEEGCFWYDISQLAPPNLKLCEASVCSIIVEPANTWSNLAYIAVGLLMIWIARKGMGNNPPSFTMKMFAPAAFTVGITSFIYHASYNFFTQVGDYVGMFIYTGLLLTLNFRRLHILSYDRQLTFLITQLIIFISLVLVFYQLGWPYQVLVLLQILTIAGSEVILLGRSNDRLMPLLTHHITHDKTGQTDNQPSNRPEYRYLFLALILIIAAAGFSAADATRVLCDPNNHIFQAHAAWHVLSALSLLSNFIYLRQFDFDNSK